MGVGMGMFGGVERESSLQEGSVKQIEGRDSLVNRPTSSPVEALGNQVGYFSLRFIRTATQIGSFLTE